MKKIILACLVCLACLAGSSAAHAQGYIRPPTSPFYQPPVSPYMNLMLPGVPGINYYGLVQPQIAFGTSINRLQQQQAVLQNTLGTGYDPNSVYPYTGHPAVFSNYSHYFMYRGGAGFPAGIPRSMATPLNAPVATAAAGITPPANPPMAAPPAGPRPPRTGR